MGVIRWSFVAAVGIAVVACSAAAGANNLPKPGTPTAVAALVKASVKIESLPSNLVPKVSNAADDNIAAYYPVARTGCSGPTQCVFADKGSAKVAVLFGDSHAAMWLLPLITLAKADDLRVVLLWFGGCPDADVSVWNPSDHSINTACNKFRSSSFKVIKALHPVITLVSNRTTDIHGAGNALITASAWQAGLETTLTTLQSDGDHPVVIGDITALTSDLPECLAVHPKGVQACSSPNPNPARKNLVAAEEAAATATATPYVDPQPWLCDAVCSPIVGNYIVYWDNLHVTATYSEYLATVFADAITPDIS